jgi:hypothetical protein
MRKSTGLLDRDCGNRDQSPIRNRCSIREFRSNPTVIGDPESGSRRHRSVNKKSPALRAGLFGCLSSLPRYFALARGAPERAISGVPPGKPCSARRRTPHAGTRMLPRPSAMRDGIRAGSPRSTPLSNLHRSLLCVRLEAGVEDFLNFCAAGEVRLVLIAGQDGFDESLVDVGHRRCAHLLP